MKKKKIMACLFGLSLAASTLSVSVMADRQIGTLSNFRITPQFASTNYLTKMSNSYYVVNLDSKVPQIKVKHYLANSNGDVEVILMRHGQGNEDYTRLMRKQAISTL